MVTELENASFHFSPKEEQCQRMFKLPHNFLEKEMATYSSILAWKIAWTEKPGGLQFMGSQRDGDDRATEHKAHVHSSHTQQGDAQNPPGGALPAQD